MSNENKAKETKSARSGQVIKAASSGAGPDGNGADRNSGNETGRSFEPKVPPRLQDTFVDERNDVLTVINELEDQLDRHQEIRTSLERELTNATEQLQSSNQKNQELEWQVVTLQTRVDALEQVKQEVAALEEEITDANGRAQRLSEQLNISEKERTRLKTELKAANKQIDELWPVRKERDGLRADCKTLSMKVDELERFQRDIIEERTQLQARVQDLQVENEDLRNERNQLDKSRRIADERVRELTQIEEAMSDKVDNLRAEKKNLQAQLAHLERENTRLVEQRQYYESEVTSLRNQSRTAETALASVKKAFSEVRVALTETKTRARRRAHDSWPRVGTTLHGVTGTREAGVAGDEDIPTLEGVDAGTQAPQDVGGTE